ARIIPPVSLNEIRLLTWEGSIETWVKTNSVYRTRHHEYRGELTHIVETGDFEWITPERLVFHFREPGAGDVMAGRLLEIRDFNNNKISLDWNTLDGRITNI